MGTLGCPHVRSASATYEGEQKRRAQRAHRMQARTRTLPSPSMHSSPQPTAPICRPPSCKTSPRPRRSANLRRAGEHLHQHASGKQADRVRINVLQDGTEKRVDIPYTVTRAFATWTIIEILRHTGIRIEEMLRTDPSERRAVPPSLMARVIPLLQSRAQQDRSRADISLLPRVDHHLARLVEFISIDGRVPCAAASTHRNARCSARSPHLDSGSARAAGHGSSTNAQSENGCPNRQQHGFDGHRRYGAALHAP